MAQRVRLNQLHLPDGFDDQLSAAQVQAIEGAASSLEEYLSALLSQLKRIIHGDEAGDYKDDPVTVFGEDASLKGLLNRMIEEEGMQNIVYYDEDGSYSYVGEATPGTVTSDAAWRIYRLDETGGNSVELKKLYANGSTDYDQVWNNRAALPYS